MTLFKDIIQGKVPFKKIARYKEKKALHETNRLLLNFRDGLMSRDKSFTYFLIK